MLCNIFDCIIDFAFFNAFIIEMLKSDDLSYKSVKLRTLNCGWFPFFRIFAI